MKSLVERSISTQILVASVVFYMYTYMHVHTQYGDQQGSVGGTGTGTGTRTGTGAGTGTGGISVLMSTSSSSVATDVLFQELDMAWEMKMKMENEKENPHPTNENRPNDSNGNWVEEQQQGQQQQQQQPHVQAINDNENGDHDVTGIHGAKKTKKTLIMGDVNENADMDTDMDANGDGSGVYGYESVELNSNSNFNLEVHSLDAMESFLKMHGHDCAMTMDAHPHGHDHGHSHSHVPKKDPQGDASQAQAQKRTQSRSRTHLEAFQMLRRNPSFHSHAEELWKYCYLAHQLTLPSVGQMDRNANTDVMKEQEKGKKTFHSSSTSTSRSTSPCSRVYYVHGDGIILNHGAFADMGDGDDDKEEEEELTSIAVVVERQGRISPSLLSHSGGSGYQGYEYVGGNGNGDEGNERTTANANEPVTHYEIHGAAMIVSHCSGSGGGSTNGNFRILKSMAQFMVDHVEQLEYEPHLSNQYLYQLIAPRLKKSAVQQQQRSGVVGGGGKRNGNDPPEEQPTQGQFQNRHQRQNPKWRLWKHSCDDGCGMVDEERDNAMVSSSPSSSSLLHHCCQVVDEQGHVVLLTPHTNLPHPALTKHIDGDTRIRQNVKDDNIPLPYAYATNAKATAADGAGGNIGVNADADARTEYQPDPYITTIREEIVAPYKHKNTNPRNKNRRRHKRNNFLQIITEKDCLPTSRICEACMKDQRGGNCAKCRRFCGCFCDYLCSEHVKQELESEGRKKVVRKIMRYTLPKYQRGMYDGGTYSTATRLIPRIVHQTWFEPVTREKYPNFSRLVESWKQTGWEYSFYNDDDAAHFLSVHFPPEVKQAYDALIPGAFKADLFRYCVLFIYGGVYADVDVLLESKLDMVIDDDVGFMVPLDTPGKETGHQMCLWNGFIASAPGHPFLAAVIETVVNNIRNRFTSVDIMNELCPGEVDFYVSFRYDVLFTGGPCILGASVNKVLGRHPQTSFDINTTQVVSGGTNSGERKAKIDEVVGANVDGDDRIPGRIVFLDENKEDMGAYRFTLRRKNLIVAATDMPNFDDRGALSDSHTPEDHYSKLRKSGKIYGMSGLYKDNLSANELIKIEG